ncbi:MAG: hypothetical protein GX868_12325 [Actinobacteria bacterium]|nr:hypothetical protein [Actinomycetota bacterium]
MTRRTWEAVTLVVIALVVGLALAPFASGSPDGFERVAVDTGFGEAARDSVAAVSPLADYASGPVSSVVGVSLVVVVGGGIVRLLRVRQR